jgi:hypothetical protein
MNTIAQTTEKNTQSFSLWRGKYHLAPLMLRLVIGYRVIPTMRTFVGLTPDAHGATENGKNPMNPSTNGATLQDPSRVSALISSNCCLANHQEINVTLH